MACSAPITVFRGLNALGKRKSKNHRPQLGGEEET